jgi:hypothetical protein
LKASAVLRGREYLRVATCVPGYHESSSSPPTKRSHVHDILYGMEAYLSRSESGTYGTFNLSWSRNSRCCQDLGSIVRRPWPPLRCLPHPSGALLRDPGPVPHRCARYPGGSGGVQAEPNARADYFRAGVRPRIVAQLQHVRALMLSCKGLLGKVLASEFLNAVVYLAILYMSANGPMTHCMED